MKKKILILFIVCLCAFNLQSSPRVSLNYIYFEPNSCHLDSSAINYLHRITEFLNSYPELVIEIRGYSDTLECNKTDTILSYKRAKSVYNALDSLGARICEAQCIGKGGEFPIAPHDLPEQRAMNRRAEFVLIMKKPDITDSILNREMYSLNYKDSMDYMIDTLILDNLLTKVLQVSEDYDSLLLRFIVNSHFIFLDEHAFIRPKEFALNYLKDHDESLYHVAKQTEDKRVKFIETAIHKYDCKNLIIKIDSDLLSKQNNIEYNIYKINCINE